MKPSVLVLLTIATLVGCNRIEETSSPQTVNEEASVPDTLPNAIEYSNESFNYSIQVPQDLEVQTVNEYSLQLVPINQEAGPGPANFIYVSIIPADQQLEAGSIYNFSESYYQKLETLEIGESVSLSEGEPDLSEYFTYTRVDDLYINDLQVKRFENNKPWEFPSGTTETRVQFARNGTRYLLGSYTGGESVAASIDPRTAHAILESFKIND